MPLLKLSCASCSAPLEIGEDLERFACSYCGTEQIVERSGGVVWLRKVEMAIQAVQRGTDRTAAELALVRLGRELAEAEAGKAALLQKASAEKTKAEEDRAKQTLASFAIVLVGVPLFFAFISNGNLKGWHFFIWAFLLIAFPFAVYQSITMSFTDIRQPLENIDAHMAQIQKQIAHHRAILDAPTA